MCMCCIQKVRQIYFSLILWSPAFPVLDLLSSRCYYLVKWRREETTVLKHINIQPKYLKGWERFISNWKVSIWPPWAKVNASYMLSIELWHQNQFFSLFIWYRRYNFVSFSYRTDYISICSVLELDIVGWVCMPISTVELILEASHQNFRLWHWELKCLNPPTELSLKGDDQVQFNAT